VLTQEKSDHYAKVLAAFEPLRLGENPHVRYYATAAANPSESSAEAGSTVSFGGNQVRVSTSVGNALKAPKGSIPMLVRCSTSSSKTSSLRRHHVDAKHRQNVQPARSRMRWRDMSLAHRSGPWNASPSHSMASRASFAPSTTMSSRYEPLFTCGMTRYVMSHQGIAFADTGELVDGQHRLTAIAELPDGFCFPMLVTRGLSCAQVFRVIDGGYKRAVADMIGRDRRKVEVARLIFDICSTTPSTPTALLPVCERIPPWHADLIGFCSATVRTWSSAPVRTAAVLSMMDNGDADYVRLVYRALVMNDLPDMPRSAQALVTAFLRGQIKAQNPYDLFCRLLRVFDPTKESLTKIQVHDQSAMIAHAREFAAVAIFGEPPKKKKAEAKATAPKGNARPNHTPHADRAPLH
jgi:hypothetical protein